LLVPDNTLSWPEIAMRLAAARNYWLCTTMPSGAPHAAPAWGVVTGQALHLYSERRTVKARNLAADSRLVVHVESGEDVLIVRGTAEDLGPLPMSLTWWRPWRRNTPARVTGSICPTPTPISTWSPAFNRRAITVYRRAGFQEVDRFEHLTNGGRHAFIRMARSTIESCP
jgi:pyridoxamine 5'-phosphate oxidase-like protein